MQPFIFISHAGDDKPRIRFITDGLIKAGYRLWLDSPEKMGYTAKQIKSSFERIMPGLRWEDEIHDALRYAGCVLFLASNRFLEGRRKQWHKEVTYACVEGTLLTVKIEAVTLPGEIAAFQWQDLSYEVDGARLSPEQIDNRLELLVEAIKHTLNTRRASRFGIFGDAGSQNGGRPPTEEQLERFFMMMDRERETHALASSPAPMLFLKGEPEARPSYVRRRLPEIELPSRSAASRLPSSNSIASAELRRVRAELLCGDPSEDERVWRSILMPWPIAAGGGAKSPKREFVRSLIAKSPLPLRSITPGDDDAATMAAYCKALQASRFNVFACSTIEDASHLRRSHLKLIGEVGALLTSAPAERFRLLLSVSPSVSKSLTDWFTGGSAWLERALDPTKHGGPILLADVAQQDLEEWVELMALLVKKTETAIGDAVAKAFVAGRVGKRMPLAALEQCMRPETATWRMRERRAGAPVTETRGRWADEHV